MVDDVEDIQKTPNLISGIVDNEDEIWKQQKAIELYDFVKADVA